MDKHFLEAKFFDDYKGAQRLILDYFHNLFVNQLMLEAKLKYKIPFYYRHGWICYLNPIPSNGVELGFTRGNELSNKQGLLISRGRKQVAGVEFYSLQDIPHQAISELIHEAILLDETIPYSIHRKKQSRKI